MGYMRSSCGTSNCINGTSKTNKQSGMTKENLSLKTRDGQRMCFNVSTSKYLFHSFDDEEAKEYFNKVKGIAWLQLNGNKLSEKQNYIMQKFWDDYCIPYIEYLNGTKTKEQLKK